MENLTQSQSIKLGIVLEKCLAPIIKELGYSYKNSEAYAELLTRPDFILFQDHTAILSIAVTATSSRDTWIKKRWRYVDEVSQLKSYYGPDFLTLNLIFGDPGVFGIHEMDFINAFFDCSIIADEFESGAALVSKAEHLVRYNKKLSGELLSEQLMETTAWSAFKLDLLERLNSIIKRRAALTAGNMYRPVWQREYPTYKGYLAQIKSKQYSTAESYLRYAFLNGLLVGKENFDALVCNVVHGTPLPAETVQACSITHLGLTKISDEYFVSDEKFKKTVDAGMTGAVYQEIERNAVTKDTQKFLLEDIQNKSRIQKMVDVIWPILRNKEELIQAVEGAYLSNEWMGLKHARVWPLDVVTTYLGLSVVRLNKMYVDRYHPRVTSMVSIFVSKTRIAQAQFADRDVLHRFCEELIGLIQEETNRTSPAIGKDEVLEKLQKYKIDSLFLQPYINPLQCYVEFVFERNGWTYTKKSIECSLAAIPNIPNSMKNIREIYQIQKGERELWVKCIAGYAGVKDKTREMAARGHLLQYRSPTSPKRAVKMIFVYDGKWSKDLQQILALSGWSDIIPVFELEKYLNQ